ALPICRFGAQALLNLCFARDVAHDIALDGCRQERAAHSARMRWNTALGNPERASFMLVSSDAKNALGACGTIATVSYGNGGAMQRSLIVVLFAFGASNIALAQDQAPELPSGWTAKKAISTQNDMVAAANPLAVEAGRRIMSQAGTRAD